MKLYQIIDAFIHSTSHSSLFSIWEQTKTTSYKELTDFFKSEYLTQDSLLNQKNKKFKVNEGYLMFDEIVISKSKSNNCKFIKRRYKSAGGYIVPGVSLVVLVWSNGVIRVPIRFRIQVNGEKHTSTALNLLSWFRNKVSRKINYITFDTGFSSELVLKRINDYGWCFVTRVPNTRKFNDKQTKKTHRGGYWTRIGFLKELKVKAVRRKKKFYVTNRLTLKTDKIEAIYTERAGIEEVFRVLKQECHWERCQLRQHKHYENYYLTGLLTFICLEQLRIEGFGSTIYRIRRNLHLGHVKLPNDYLKRILA